MREIRPDRIGAINQYLTLNLVGNRPECCFIRLKRRSKKYDTRIPYRLGWTGDFQVGISSQGFLYAFRT